MNQKRTDHDVVLQRIKKQDFLSFLETAKQFKVIDIDSLYKAYCEGNSNLPPLYERWENSVNDKTFDYSVYDDDAYLNEAFYCWKKYARTYILLLKKYITLDYCEMNVDNIYSVVDLGCGCGYSTIALKSVFKKAKIVGTNLKGTLQYKIDEDVCGQFEDCSMVDESETLNLGKVDVVFASEFFEHLQSPKELLDGLIKEYQPKYFIVANTFTKMSLGHFDSYRWNGVEMSGREVSKKFNDYLRANGYVDLETRFFNHRPKIWKKVGEEDALF